jgi:meso-butanediol dehydrogenase/(S,S)-butanediol dehydrogenase/diacetyl reductase
MMRLRPWPAGAVGISGAMMRTMQTELDPGQGWPPPPAPGPRRVAVVTGAARGIGLAIAGQFLADGWSVVMLDRDQAMLAESSRQLSVAGESRVLAVEADVSDPRQVEAAARQVGQAFGGVDALVNNAGVAVFAPIAETSWAAWREVMATNLDGPFLCTQALLPLLRRRAGAAVVNIASISGLRASTLRVAYGTSKAALIHLTRQQAVELGDIGIRVNAVAPGPVETAMAQAVHTPAIRADYRATIPLGRYGSLQEIAAVVHFLCTPAAGYINGQVLAVDGGFDAAGVGLPTLRETRAQEPRR